MPGAARRLEAGALAFVMAALAAGAAAQSPPAAQSPEPQAEPSTPEEMRARERMVLLALSTVVLAERMYAAANGTFFGEMKCLTRPAECSPGRDADTAPFLDPGFDWMAVRFGYERKFHPGPPATEDQIRRAKAAPDSLTAYAFTATPTRPGVTGKRGFCADSTGKFCMTLDGKEPPVRNGRCDPCKKLE